MRKILIITYINVSYEYTEFQVTLNDPDGSRETRQSFRLVGLYRISNRGLGGSVSVKRLNLLQTWISLQAATGLSIMPNTNYKGLNPYGQLRNYPGYPFFGLALTYKP